MIGLIRNLSPILPLVEGEAGNRSPQRLAGAGAAETQTSRRLTPGKLYLLLVGAAGVRIRASSDGALGAGAVDPVRDVVYGPWSAVPFVADKDSTFIYAEAADAAANYECFVVQYGA